MKNIKYVIAAIMCSIAIAITVGGAIAKPITAEAFHWDFWNSYEDDCLVVYEQVGYNIYKVIVVSEDGKTVWRNDVSSVPFWYPAVYLSNIIGTTPGNSGSATVDILSDVLNNPSYFARFAA